MKKIFVSASIIFSLVAFSSCNNTSKSDTTSLTKEITFTKQGELTLKKAENDSIIATLDIEIADNDYKTQTGLMYRSSMEEKQGMLFIFPTEEPRWFYMKNTEISLDILYFDSKMVLIDFHENTQPRSEASIPSSGPTQYVLEVNAGLSKKWGLERGDTFEFTRN